MKRRTFLKQSGRAFGVGALLITGTRSGRAHAARVTPSDQVRVAVIGTGGMGGRHVEALAENPNCHLPVLCDVVKGRYLNRLEKVAEMTGRRPEGIQDFRYVLDRDDVDAIFVATPDHWHPLLTVLGCQAGKDVYVEKPASPTVAEGRAMVEAARRYGRVVQLGTQQRSMPVFQRAIDVIRSGRLGTITSASAWVSPNGWGVGRKVEDVPAGLDWDLWLGPAPWEPFSMERYGGFMGNHDYARGGQLTNWGVHLMDIVHWGIGQDQPLNVQAMGTSARGGAGAENFETIDALFEYPGVSVTWEQRFSNDKAGKGLGIMFQGTEGRLLVDRATYKVFPDTLGIEEFIGEPERSWANPDHHNNFFDCVRTRKRPAAEIEQGVRSTIPVLLAGIALKTRRKLNWDAANERFINDDAANRYLSRAYRPPWRLL
ncbi:MAG: Gfo/Idh/MocA family oxidoreductase [Candidatus Hydrogenedentes bacterium]|nr:Gfo/Idh/MocA family oxidoreductase [Candidatus Hydrogenedentota bacterium]